MSRWLSVTILMASIVFCICFVHEHSSGGCSHASHDGHDHHHHHHHDGHDNHHHDHNFGVSRSMLPEELAEEEDLKLYGFGSHRSLGDDDSELSRLGLWVHAMGCSMLVSMASLICLIFLPVIFLKGKPSKTVVDSLAVFGAGAMLGDAFLHQLPHAFGGGHSHSHDDHMEHSHDHSHHHGHAQSHSHSLKDLSVGLSILSGIVLFLLVEKVVRYVEEYSGKGLHSWGHVHHHHHHHHHNKNDNKLEHDDGHLDNLSSLMNGNKSEMASDKKLDGVSDDYLNNEKHNQHEMGIRKRGTSAGATDDGKPGIDAANKLIIEKAPLSEKAPARMPSSLVFGYLNLFSDGVHNFTDGMALGSAFLLHGTVGGWSRTLFLLAHELPQEVGDFGILVRSGFSVSKALFFNFLSALVALAGTALALLLGKDPGQSSLIEGFTAGGFIYIAIAGVLPEINSGSTTFKSTAIHLTSLVMGMAVALWISLVE